MKKKLILSILFISSLALSQENIKYPIFPGCKKFTTNDDLKKCFSEKLWYELNDQTQNSGETFFKENKISHDLTLYFTIKKDGKVTDYSYSADSDALISTTYLKRISKIFKYYEEKGKKITPASLNNKNQDFKIQFKVKYRG